MADYYYTKKTGRPTKFKARYVKDMIRFFEDAPLTKKSGTGFVKEYYKDGTIKRDSETYKEVAAMFPTLLQFAKHIDVDYATVNRWATSMSEDDYLEKLKSSKGVNSEDVKMALALQKFREVYAQAKQFQKEFMVNNGMSGASPSSAFVFVAKNVTDMRDKSVHDVTHRKEKPLLHNLDKEDVILNHDSDEESSGS